MTQKFVENTESIRMPDLLREAKKNLKVALLQNELHINSIPSQITTSATGGGGYRYWFTCPKCSQRCGILFRQTDKIACRRCCKLKYKKQYNR